MPRKPGPKTELGGAAMRRRTLTYDETTERMLRVLGGGNASRGVRVAARAAFKARSLNACNLKPEPAAPSPASAPPDAPASSAALPDESQA